MAGHRAGPVQRSAGADSFPVASGWQTAAQTGPLAWELDASRRPWLPDCIRLEEAFFCGRRRRKRYNESTKLIRTLPVRRGTATRPCGSYIERSPGANQLRRFGVPFPPLLWSEAHSSGAEEGRGEHIYFCCAHFLRDHVRNRFLEGAEAARAVQLREPPHRKVLPLGLHRKEARERNPDACELITTAQNNQ